MFPIPTPKQDRERNGEKIVMEREKERNDKHVDFFFGSRSDGGDIHADGLGDAVGRAGVLRVVLELVQALGSGVGAIALPRLDAGEFLLVGGALVAALHGRLAAVGNGGLDLFGELAQKRLECRSTSAEDGEVDLDKRPFGSGSGIV
jgi:hypothetical protein